MTEISRELVEACAKDVPSVRGYEPTNLEAMTIAKAVIRTMLERVTLEWVKHPSAEAWRCSTPIGTYKVFAVSGPASWDFDGFGPNCITKTADTVDAAKSAALAHYRAEWLSAVVLDKP